jgi:hypothetical protein
MTCLLLLLLWLLLLVERVIRRVSVVGGVGVAVGGVGLARGVGLAMSMMGDSMMMEGVMSGLQSA